MTKIRSADAIQAQGEKIRLLRMGANVYRRACADGNFELANKIKAATVEELGELSRSDEWEEYSEEL